MALATSTVIGLIAAGASAYGAAEQGKSAKKQADFQSKQADFQALVEEQQAAREREIAGQQERDFRKEQSARLAEFRASMGSSGTRLDTGTPLLAESDFASETERNARRIREGGRIGASRLEQQADQSRQSGGLYRTAGVNAQKQGYYRAGASLLSGASSSFK